MNIIETRIPEVKILEPQVFGDERGFFMETWRDDWFNTEVCERFVQDNHSKSRRGSYGACTIRPSRPGVSPRRLR